MLARIRFCAVLAGLLVAGTAVAQANYPNKPIRLITPFNPGGAIDIYSRLIAEPLGKRLGQNIIVEAIAGANTIVGTQAVVRATPDGHTFMITTMSTMVNNKILYSKSIAYDPNKDLAPITQLSYGTVLLVGPASAAYTDLKSFVAWAKAQPRVTFGSWGIAFEAPRYSSSAGPDFQPHAHAAHLGRHRRGLIQPFMA